jgi:hypothetical protein
VLDRLPVFAGSEQAAGAVRHADDDGPGRAVIAGEHLDQAAIVGEADRGRGFLVLVAELVQDIIPLAARHVAGGHGRQGQRDCGD